MADDIDTLRDRLAGLCGWEWFGSTDVAGCGAWWRGEDHTYAHPFPPNDLTALAAAWPEGWEWCRNQAEWTGLSRGGQMIFQRNTGDEYADRLRLTVKVLEAIAATPKG